MSTQLNARVLALLVLALAVVAGFALGVYALTDPSQRPELLHTVAKAWPALLAAIPAAGAYVKATQLGQAHAQTADAVVRIEHQTNGQLTARLDSHREQLKAELLAELRASGGLPPAPPAPDVAGAPSLEDAPVATAPEV